MGKGNESRDRRLLASEVWQAVKSRPELVRAVAVAMAEDLARIEEARDQAREIFSSLTQGLAAR